MKKIITTVCAIIMGCFAATSPAMLSSSAYANTCGGVDTAILQCNDDGKGIEHILILVKDIMMTAVGILAVIGIGVSGIQYLTAGGNEEKTRKAKRRIFEIVIGLAVFVLLYAILSWLLPSFDPAAGANS